MFAVFAKTKKILPSVKPRANLDAVDEVPAGDAHVKPLPPGEAGNTCAWQSVTNDSFSCEGAVNEEPGLRAALVASSISSIPIPVCAINKHGTITCRNHSFIHTTQSTTIESFVQLVCAQQRDTCLAAFESQRCPTLNPTKITLSILLARDMSYLTVEWTFKYEEYSKCIIACGVVSQSRTLSDCACERNTATLASPTTHPTETANSTSLSFAALDRREEGSGRRSRLHSFALSEDLVDSVVTLPWDHLMQKVQDKTNKTIALRVAQVRTESLLGTLELKRALIRNVSHELRTPLSVVMSGLVAMQGGVNAADRELVSEMELACELAVDTLDDLVLYERVECGSLEITRAHVDFLALVPRAVDSLRSFAAHSGIDLSLSTPSGDDFDVCIVNGDEPKLLRVLRKLIANGLKATPAGGRVLVSVHRIEHSRTVRVEVQDSGPGMDAASRALATDEALEFDPAELQPGQGRGLGMYLSRRVVSLHGGVLGVVDSDGSGETGAVFFAELPVTQRPNIAMLSLRRRAAPEAPLRRGLRLLVVDDVALCRKLHCRVLSPSVAETVEAVNGQQAVELVREAIEQGRSFDAILMDNSMPVMNGNAATRLIRALGFAGKVYGVTGNALQSDVDDFIAHGADEVLLKPLSAALFAHILNSLEERQ